jgi:hypothetical protein
MLRWGIIQRTSSSNDQRGIQLQSIRSECWVLEEFLVVRFLRKVRVGITYLKLPDITFGTAIR